MGDLIRNIGSVLSTFSFIDILDVLAVVFIVYYAISLAKETRAMQLIKSIGVIFVVYFIANYFKMITLRYILQKILDVGLIVIVVLFQPELRRAMERIGRSKLTDLTLSRIATPYEREQAFELVDIVSDSCREIIGKAEGALIVLERKIRLGDIINTGTTIDGEISSELLSNIFFKNAPLHDGAVVISDYRIAAAGCYLPLTENEELEKELGTRHRAAIGISEMSDAITIVVSEERGTISIAENGEIVTYKSVKEMGQALKAKLVPDENKGKKRWIFGDKTNGKKK